MNQPSRGKDIAESKDAHHGLESGKSRILGTD